MFLANENFPKPSVDTLRERGFQVKCICEESPGISDSEVVEIAIRHKLIILTFDKDYGELIFRHARNNPPSVIFFREKGNNPTFPGEVLIPILDKSIMNFENSFTVVETNSIRQRFYKKG
jgi:predicted nuclease of predicted toxin-antitoxin system